MTSPGSRTPPPNSLAAGESLLAFVGGSGGTGGTGKAGGASRARGRIAAVVALQLAGIAMIGGGVVLMSGASEKSEVDSARAEAVLVEARADRDAASVATRALGSLPNAEQVRKNAQAALVAAEVVAAKQDALLGTYGVPSLEGVATRTTPEPGERQRELTEAERVELALQGRPEAREKLLRESVPLFETGAAAPTVWWTTSSISEDLSSWRWEAAGGGWAQDDGLVQVAWTLLDDQGEPVSVMRALYDPASRKLSEPVAPGQEW